MPKSLERIEKTIKKIDLLTDPSSKQYGRLLNWKSSHDPFWHYGIGLSDVYIFDTGKGLRPFKKKRAKFVIGINSIAFQPDVTIERLKHALYVFANWKYTTSGWNCEHLGRLIATDKPRCYQSRSVWWLCNLTPKGDHKTARKIFRNHLKKVEPKLVR
ncbi:hypothetical protein [Myxosarcina sp. GI1]|uniref:hypothetical protein n=1 Tax=Myxosarcina sp. GI1 TaxID=1541065 RepID=UPI000569D774|nr:hypothetical protein [Myxosarcina sp. GI1]